MKRFNPWDIVYFIVSNRIVKGAKSNKKYWSFVTIKFDEDNCGHQEQVFVKVNSIVQKKRQRKLLNNIKMQR